MTLHVIHTMIIITPTSVMIQVWCRPSDETDTLVRYGVVRGSRSIVTSYTTHIMGHIPYMSNTYQLISNCHECIPIVSCCTYHVLMHAYAVFVWINIANLSDNYPSWTVLICWYVHLKTVLVINNLIL